MRILMNCLSSVSGGAVSYLRNLVPSLSRQFEASPENHSLRILAHPTQRELFPSIPDAQCVWVTEERPIGWHRIVWEWKDMSRVCGEMNADILFTPYQIGPRIRELKQVLMIRNMEPFLFEAYRYSAKSRLRNHILRWQSSRALRGADRVIAVSGFAGRHLEEGLSISPDRIRKIYHGRSTALFRDPTPNTDCRHLKALGVEGTFLLTCGSLLPYRRCEDVIAAFNNCASRLHSGTQLVIAGSGTDHRYGMLIQRAIAASPYRDKILMVGHVPWNQMAALYRRCALCVIATEIEACPNIAIEAMTSGCVIVSSSNPPLPEMFQDASLEYRARDIDHLAERILLCTTNQDLRRVMKSRALQRSDKFSWATCAAETFAALTEWP